MCQTPSHCLPLACIPSCQEKDSPSSFLEVLLIRLRGVAWGWLSTVTHQRNNLISFPTAVTELILGCLPSKSYIRGPAPPLKYRTCRLLFSIFVFGKHKKLMEWRKQSERVSFYLLCQAFGEERSGHKGKHGVYMIFSTLDLPTWRFRSLPRVPCSEGLPGALHPNKPL